MSASGSLACSRFRLGAVILNMNFHCVVNYIDSTYTAEESHKRYYPTHTQKLKELKDKYDPKRVISFPQDF